MSARSGRPDCRPWPTPAGSFIIRTGGTNTAEAGPTQVPDRQTARQPPPTSNLRRTRLPRCPRPSHARARGRFAAPGKISPADFVARYANVQLEQGSPVTTEADVFGGEGNRH